MTAPPRILIAEPNADVRSFLELTVERLGYEPVAPEPAPASADLDAIIVEPGCALGRSIVHRLGDDAPPVICLSIYPREDGLEPAGSVAYLVKPSSGAAIADALRSVVADRRRL
ncbi:MAG TPA: response regulator [Gaiellaceae bacterium]|nr:response regulator [Gaiellaceae bacterium]